MKRIQINQVTWLFTEDIKSFNITSIDPKDRHPNENMAMRLNVILHNGNEYATYNYSLINQFINTMTTLF